jgi:hypothetical protein
MCGLYVGGTTKHSGGGISEVKRLMRQDPEVKSLSFLFKSALLTVAAGEFSLYTRC